MTAETREAYVGEELRSLISYHGFAIHPKKVRLMHRWQQQNVTGLVANRFPNVKRRFIRQVRSMLHAARKFGFDAAETEFHKIYYLGKYVSPSRTKPSFKKVLKGKIDFVGMIRGRLDPVYLSLSRKLQRLDPALVKRLPSERWIDEIKSAMFVIESHSDKAVSQGTGFALKGVGIVTCAHVVVAGELHIYQAFNPAKRYEAKVVTSDGLSDIAVLRLSGYGGSELLFGDDGMIDHDSEIILAGFPDYAPGNTGIIKRGRIAASFMFMGMKRFLIDTAIVFGNSGGPVLDAKTRKVIGIAVTGSSSTESADTTVKHGVIPISVATGLLI
jgi:S1-C subfamily serine protease